jgi:hypothetical protein
MNEILVLFDSLDTLDLYRPTIYAASKQIPLEKQI